MGGLQAKQTACWKPSQICNTSNKPINNRVKGQLLRAELCHCSVAEECVSNENSVVPQLHVIFFSHLLSW